MFSPEDMLLGTIAQGSFYLINQRLIRFTECDLDSVIIFSELLSQFNYRRQENLLDDEGYFYSTIDYVEQKLGMSEYRQRKAIGELEKKYKFISTKLKGLPKKRYFKINAENVLKVIASNDSITKPKKLTKEEFYKNLNTSVYLKKFEDFLREDTDNLNESVAFSIYYFSNLYKKYTGNLLNWTSKEVGAFIVWSKILLKTGPIDYSIFKDYFLSKSFSATNTIPSFYTWQKGIPPKAHSERKTNYKELLKELQEDE